MLTYTQEMEKRKIAADKLKKVSEEIKELSNKPVAKSLFQNNELEKLREREEKLKQLYIQEQTLKRYLTVAKSNCKKLYALENIQAVIDIFNKYSGRRCGEKTKENIRKEAQENGMNIYFTDDEIVFCTGLYGYDRIPVFTKYVNGIKYTITDNNNKINILDKDCFKLPDPNTIIEDIEIYVRTKEIEFFKLQQMYKELEEKIKEYNENNPFNHQSIKDGIFYMD